jgi:hypothetical protein
MHRTTFRADCWTYYIKLQSLALETKKDLESLIMDAYPEESGIDTATAKELLATARSGASPSAAIQRMAAARTNAGESSSELRGDVV